MTPNAIMSTFISWNSEVEFGDKNTSFTLGKSCVCRCCTLFGRSVFFCYFLLHFTCSTFVLLKDMENHLCLVI
jgi:hypothetical protein